MIVRIEVSQAEPGHYMYAVVHEGEELYSDVGLSSVSEALVGATEGLPPAVVAVEVAYQSIMSGTYPLNVLAINLHQIAEHACNTTASVEEALGH